MHIKVSKHFRLSFSGVLCAFLLASCDADVEKKFEHGNLVTQATGEVVIGPETFQGKTRIAAEFKKLPSKDDLSLDDLHFILWAKSKEGEAEHRLIEKMLTLAGRVISVSAKRGEIDVVFIDTMVDFIRTYADRTHHGKEEDILFRDLEKKPLSEKDRRLMQELVDEHRYARKMVGELVDARNRYVEGEEGAVSIITTKISELVSFYPEHIRKEEDEFFPAAEDYFAEADLDAMVGEFFELDRKMIHAKYAELYESVSPRYE